MRVSMYVCMHVYMHVRMSMYVSMYAHTQYTLRNYAVYTADIHTQLTPQTFLANPVKSSN